MNKISKVHLSESKSFANRILTISSFKKGTLPKYRSHADDIVELSTCLEKLKNGEREFKIGEGGTTFRFLLTRLSRERGSFKVFAKPQLLARPQQELYRLLESLGAVIEVNADSVHIQSHGWDKLKEKDYKLTVDCSQSTQFASALILCSFQLEKQLKVSLLNFTKSISYLNMTVKILQEAGMDIVIEKDVLIIEKNSVVKKIPHAEPDMSSAFSIAAIGVVTGGKILCDLPLNSLQGDSIFIDILKEMNVDFKIQKRTEEFYDLSILNKQSKLRPIKIDLAQCPDLLPVLSALCSICHGTSYITNIEHTRYKESDRIAKSEELLLKSGCSVISHLDRMEITGPLNIVSEEFEFDPANDHRMAMAAAVLKSYGVPIKILTPHVVNKSYPEFWKDALIEV